MTAFPITAEGVNFGTAYTVSTSTPEYPSSPMPAGSTVLATDGSLWVLCVASGAVTAGDFVAITTVSTWTALSVSNTQKALLNMPVGVAGATAASGQFFWVQRSGLNSIAAVATGVTANAIAHSTATAGRISSTGTGGTTVAINGVAILATAAANVAAVHLNFPVIGTAD